MEFAYVAKNSNGEEVTGHLPANNIDDVVDHLHGKGLSVLHVAEKKGHHDPKSFFKKMAAISFGKVPTRDVALFSRQLSTVLEAGIPLVRGLRGLAADTGSKALGKAVADIGERLERGENLSDALAAHPEAFNEMYVSMVRAGERAGTLDQIVQQLAIYLEKTDGIQTKVKSAMSYPVFLLIFTILGTLFLLLKIVPTFAGIYADFGQDLPALTAAILAISNAIRANALVSIFVALSVFSGFYFLIRTKPGRYAKDAFLLKVPIFGPIVTKSVMSRFARTFGILLGSGLPLLDGLELVRGSAGNVVVSNAISEVKEKVAAGHGVTESFRAVGKFPEMILQLMATGEESGEMDTMLVKTSDFYDRQVEATVHGISSLIEPLMIVIVGAVIGVIVVSMFLPIFGLGEAMLQGAGNV